MSIFTFLKDAGHKLFGNDEPDAVAIKKELDSYSLGTGNVSVAVSGDTVSLAGKVKDRDAFEKAILAVGNAKGVEKVDTSGLVVEDLSQADPMPGYGTQPRFYTVKSGDTLWKIAEQQYGKGHGDKNDLIFQANRPMLSSPDKIYPGQVLRIPEMAPAMA